MNKPYSIRFPLKKERCSYDRRRWRRVVDKSGLDGARFCAAGMVNGALLYRAEANGAATALRQKIARLGMRADALWARVFAGQIDQHDARLDAASQERGRLVDQLCQRHAIVA